MTEEYTIDQRKKLFALIDKFANEQQNIFDVKNLCEIILYNSPYLPMREYISSIYDYPHFIQIKPDNLSFFVKYAQNENEVKELAELELHKDNSYSLTIFYYPDLNLEILLNALGHEVAHFLQFNSYKYMNKLTPEKKKIVESLEQYSLNTNLSNYCEKSGIDLHKGMLKNFKFYSYAQLNCEENARDKAYLFTSKFFAELLNDFLCPENLKPFLKSCVENEEERFYLDLLKRNTNFYQDVKDAFSSMTNEIDTKNILDVLTEYEKVQNIDEFGIKNLLKYKLNKLQNSGITKLAYLDTLVNIDFYSDKKTPFESYKLLSDYDAKKLFMPYIMFNKAFTLQSTKSSVFENNYVFLPPNILVEKLCSFIKNGDISFAKNIIEVLESKSEEQKAKSLIDYAINYPFNYPIKERSPEEELYKNVCKNQALRTVIEDSYQNAISNLKEFEKNKKQNNILDKTKFIQDLKALKFIRKKVNKKLTKLKDRFSIKKLEKDIIVECQNNI